MKSVCKVLIWEAGFLAVPLMWVSAAAAPKVVAEAAPRSSQTNAQYVLGAEDVIEVRVRNHSDLNRTVTIRPDGRITLPRAGEVQAAGWTASTLRAHLQKILDRTLNHASVEVEVKEARSRQARIIGAVKTPGTYSLKPNWRVMDVVAAAGGLSAKPSRVSGRLIRAGKVTPINLTQAMAQPSSASNGILNPNDLVILDERDIVRQIAVTGHVKLPGAYDLEEGLTVMKLLAQAGGPAEGAALKKAHVLRGGVPLPLDLVEAVAGGPISPTLGAFVLQPGDVLVVPENQARYGVLGQVLRPAYFPFSERASEATVLKVLAAAGGAAADADLRAATITRMTNGQTTVTPVNLDAMLKGEAPDSVTLQADDVLFIPKKTAQVHVVGQAGKPGAYDLKDDMSLMSLVSEAGSSTNLLGLKKAYILRDGVQIPVDLHAVLIEGKVDPAISGFKLRSGDVLVVPDVTAQVHIIGQVAKPGAYNLDEKLSVVSLLAQAGAFQENASLSKAYVLRAGVRIPMNLQEVLVAGADRPETANFKFQAGDVVVVPENQARYAVIGQVARPSYFPFPEQGGATVLKALAQAGGPLQGGQGGANLNSAVIVRTVNGQQNVIPINIANILKNGTGANNVLLQPEDVLYIPPRGRSFHFTDLLGPLTLLRGF